MIPGSRQAIAKTLRAEGYRGGHCAGRNSGERDGHGLRTAIAIAASDEGFLRSVVLLTALLGPSALGQHALTLHDCLSIALAHHPALVTADSLSGRRFSAGRTFHRRSPDHFARGGCLLRSDERQLRYDPAISNGGEVSGRVSSRSYCTMEGPRGLKGTQLDLEIRRLAIGRRAVERDLIAGVKGCFCHTASGT